MKYVLNSSSQLSILHSLEQILQVEETRVEVVVVTSTLSLHLAVVHPPLPRKIIEVGGVDVEIQILPLQIVQSAKCATKQVIQPLTAIIGMIIPTPLSPQICMFWYHVNLMNYWIFSALLDMAKAFPLYRVVHITRIWIIIEFQIQTALSLWETAPPAPFFIGCWAKPTWMGGVMLLSLKMEVRLVIFFPLD